MKTALRYGLIAVFVICVPMYGPFFVFGLDPEWMSAGEVVGYTGMFLGMTATLFAMAHEQRQRGPLRYGQALAVGVGVAVIAALAFGLATWAFLAWSGDALPEASYQLYVQNIRDAAIADAEKAQRMAELETMRPMFFNKAFSAALMAATVFLIGVFESLVGAWWVVRGGRRD